MPVVIKSWSKCFRNLVYNLGDTIVCDCIHHCTVVPPKCHCTLVN